MGEGAAVVLEGVQADLKATLEAAGAEQEAAVSKAVLMHRIRLS
jgi:hypothetical protein